MSQFPNGSKMIIIESLKFVLKNNNFLFDNLQLLGTAMGTKCTPPFACLTVGYIEETKLFTNKLPKYFNESECKLIMELLKRDRNDGFIFWPLKFKNMFK